VTPIAGLIAWPRADDPIRQLVRMTRGGCHWILHRSISECIALGQFEDIDAPYVAGVSNDAARIAAMVRILENGGRLHPLDVILDRQPRACDHRRWELFFQDGSHRFRAYQYIGRTHAIPARLWDRAGAGIEVLDGVFLSTIAQVRASRGLIPAGVACPYADDCEVRYRRGHDNCPAAEGNRPGAYHCAHAFGRSLVS
jgi:hypothetical protein